MKSRLGVPLCRHDQMLRSTLLLTLLIALTSVSARSNGLYLKYLLRTLQLKGKQPAKEFCRLFVHSLHRSVPEIDVLLGEKKTALLQPNRELYQKYCKDQDPFLSRWMREQFEEITKDQKSVNNEMMLGLWEAFRKLPCPSYVNYDASRYGYVFIDVFGITADHFSKYSKSEKLITAFNTNLSSAMKRLSRLDINDNDKIQLAVDAFDKNYLTASEEQKAAHMRTFLLTQKFAEGSILNLIKMKLQAKQAETVAKNKQLKALAAAILVPPIGMPPQLPYSTRKLFFEYMKEWKPNQSQVPICPAIPNRLLVDFFQNIVTSFYSDNHKLESIKSRLKELEQPTAPSPLVVEVFKQYFCSIVQSTQMTLRGKVLSLYEGFEKVPYYHFNRPVIQNAFAE